jgi:group II intron reverse transcriptase/maturase
MPTSLRGIAKRARRDKKARFRDLYGLLNQQNLRWCFYQLRKDGATGVDQVTFAEYERDLDTNLDDLVQRLKRKRYRAKLVRRKWIPKAGGKLRPLGIPALEDKLLQLAAARLLTAIYEQDFLENSWGYRPGRGPREASRVLEDQLFRGKYGWVVEADIRGFFDNISHEWMLRMLGERVDDRAFLRLIGKWLKAGVLEEDGRVLHPATGTPQGGIVSPVLANIYLHYALDLWFERVVRKGCRGQAYLMRFADDFVCAFQYRDDAERLMGALPVRLKKFGLTVAEEKTRLLRFSRFELESNEAFGFLGFEFRWEKSRHGKAVMRRRTQPRKLQASIRALAEWIRENRHGRVTETLRQLSAKLRGYWNYYGVRGNYGSLNRYYFHCQRLLYKWLNRRSQRNSYTWKGFTALLKRECVPTPCIVERIPQPQLL